MKQNPKNSFYFIHPDDDDKHVFLFEESNHRWSTLRNYAKNREQHKDKRFLLIIGVNGGSWDKGIYSNSLYTTIGGNVVRTEAFKSEVIPKRILIPHVIYDIHKDKVYRLKMRLRSFTEIVG